jgi:2-dehydropantoate 2-reductase
MSSVSRTDPALSEIYLRLVREGLAIARAHGYPLDGVVVPERLLAALLDHRPSLLQDYERRRPMEIGEIINAPAAFARAAGVATPTLDALAAVVTRRARERGLLA